jgi:hypothetical protein
MIPGDCISLILVWDEPKEQSYAAGCRGGRCTRQQSERLRESVVPPLMRNFSVRVFLQLLLVSADRDLTNRKDPRKQKSAVF